VVTVSPVPLGSTYTAQDVVVANTESKSILRAVAARVCHEFPNVHYFPAYEMCIVFERSKRNDVYENDGRHVMPETVSEIISSFLEAFTSGIKK
jgi:hypothetical protein